MKIGKYTIHTVETGTFGLDGGAMFGIIPKPLWEKTNPADEKNRITLGARALFLVSGSRKILIDTGIGGFWDEKFTDIYRIDQTEKSLQYSLSGLGFSVEDITDVILTHLHFDHVGGAVSKVDNKWMPTFPNAKYHVQNVQFEWAKHPSDRDKGSFIKERFMPLAEEGVLNLVSGTEKFDDEIELQVTNGHTFAQQIVKISDESQTLIHCGDLIPTSSHIPIPFVMGYDIQPIITVKEKHELFSQAMQEEWKLFFEHDPVALAATVQMTGKGYRIKDKFTELD